MKHGISVIICCFNSRNRIKETLNHLALQNFNKEFQWEIIIVNNLSTDNTVDKAAEVWYDNIKKPNIDFKIVNQDIPGLSFAREKGIQQAKYEYLLFCDDDNWLSSNYLETVFDIMNNNKQIGALGGLGVPKFEIEPDKWIIQFQGVYATGPQAQQTGEVKSHHVYGAACCYRKSAIEILFTKGFSHYLTGRQGKNLTAGEDYELCYALVLSGYKIWYDERLKFQHFIPKDRINYNYIKKSIVGFSNSAFYLNIYKILIKYRFKDNFKKKWLWIVINKIRFLSKDFIQYNKTKTPFAKTIFKTSLKSTLFLILNRRKFNTVLRRLETSNWAQSNMNMRN